MIASKLFKNWFLQIHWKIFDHLSHNSN